MTGWTEEKHVHQQESIKEKEESAKTHRLSTPEKSEPPSITRRIKFNTMVKLDKESG